MALAYTLIAIFLVYYTARGSYLVVKDLRRVDPKRYGLKGSWKD